MWDWFFGKKAKSEKINESGLEKLEPVTEAAQQEKKSARAEKQLEERSAERVAELAARAIPKPPKTEEEQQELEEIEIKDRVAKAHEIATRRKMATKSIETEVLSGPIVEPPQVAPVEIAGAKDDAAPVAKTKNKVKMVENPLASSSRSGPWSGHTTRALPDDDSLSDKERAEANQDAADVADWEAEKAEEAEEDAQFKQADRDERQRNFRKKALKQARAAYKRDNPDDDYVPPSDVDEDEDVTELHDLDQPYPTITLFTTDDQEAARLSIDTNPARIDAEGQWHGTVYNLLSTLKEALLLVEKGNVVNFDLDSGTYFNFDTDFGSFGFVKKTLDLNAELRKQISAERSAEKELAAKERRPVRMGRLEKMVIQFNEKNTENYIAYLEKHKPAAADVEYLKANNSQAYKAYLKKYEPEKYSKAVLDSLNRGAKKSKKSEKEIIPDDLISAFKGEKQKLEDQAPDDMVSRAHKLVTYQKIIEQLEIQRDTGHINLLVAIMDARRAIKEKHESDHFKGNVKLLLKDKSFKAMGKKFEKAINSEFRKLVKEEPSSWKEAIKLAASDFWLEQRKQQLAQPGQKKEKQKRKKQAKELLSPEAIAEFIDDRESIPVLDIEAQRKSFMKEMIKFNVKINSSESEADPDGDKELDYFAAFRSYLTNIHPSVYTKFDDFDKYLKALPANQSKALIQALNIQRQFLMTELVASEESIENLQPQLKSIDNLIQYVVSSIPKPELEEEAQKLQKELQKAEEGIRNFMISLGFEINEQNVATPKAGQLPKAFPMFPALYNEYVQAIPTEKLKIAQKFHVIAKAHQDAVNLQRKKMEKQGKDQPSVQSKTEWAPDYRARGFLSSLSTVQKEYLVTTYDSDFQALLDKELPVGALEELNRSIKILDSNKEQPSYLDLEKLYRRLYYLQNQCLEREDAYEKAKREHPYSRIPGKDERIQEIAKARRDLEAFQKEYIHHLDPKLLDPGMKRQVELMNEIDQLKAAIQPKKSSWPFSAENRIIKAGNDKIQALIKSKEEQLSAEKAKVQTPAERNEELSEAEQRQIDADIQEGVKLAKNVSVKLLSPKFGGILYQAGMKNIEAGSKRKSGQFNRAISDEMRALDVSASKKDDAAEINEREANKKLEDAQKLEDEANEMEMAERATESYPRITGIARFFGIISQTPEQSEINELRDKAKALRKDAKLSTKVAKRLAKDAKKYRDKAFDIGEKEARRIEGLIDATDELPEISEMGASLAQKQQAFARATAALRAANNNLAAHGKSSAFHFETGKVGGQITGWWSSIKSPFIRAIDYVTRPSQMTEQDKVKAVRKAQENYRKAKENLQAELSELGLTAEVVNSKQFLKDKEQRAIKAEDITDKASLLKALEYNEKTIAPPAALEGTKVEVVTSAVPKQMDPARIFAEQAAAVEAEIASAAALLPIKTEEPEPPIARRPLPAAIQERVAQARLKKKSITLDELRAANLTAAPQTPPVEEEVRLVANKEPEPPLLTGLVAHRRQLDDATTSTASKPSGAKEKEARIDGDDVPPPSTFRPPSKKYR